MTVKSPVLLFRDFLLTAILFIICVNLSYAEETINNLPMFLDLGAKKCIPCKKMAPAQPEL